jgi:hypothetical protein
MAKRMRTKIEKECVASRITKYVLTTVLDSDVLLFGSVVDAVVFGAAVV